MKNIKDITLSAFAVIGFYTIITAFTSTESNPAQQVVNGTPESHVWEMHLEASNATFRAFSINKKTGEVRQYQAAFNTWSKKDGGDDFGTYKVSTELSK